MDILIANQLLIFLIKIHITSIKFSNIFKSVDNCEKIINRLSLMMLRMYNCLKKEYKETIKNLSLLECHYRADLYNFFTIRSHISDSLRTYLNDTIYPGLLNKLEILYPQRNLYYVFPMKKTDY